jgi:alkylation response protein AidB-like acyl-CoA dehydrogenase
MLNSGKIPSYEAAMLKMVVAETEQRLAETAMQILGPCGQIREGSKWAQADGLFENLYRSSLENLLTRGTSEIIRSVIAQRGLGLPRR